MREFRRDLKILTLMAIIVTISGTAFAIAYCVGDLSSYQTGSADSISLQTSAITYYPHEPILINNDTELNLEAVANSWLGSGSHDAPI